MNCIFRLEEDMIECFSRDDVDVLLTNNTSSVLLDDRLQKYVRQALNEHMGYCDSVIPMYVKFNGKAVSLENDMSMSEVLFSEILGDLPITVAQASLNENNLLFVGLNVLNQLSNDTTSMSEAFTGELLISNLSTTMPPRCDDVIAFAPSVPISSVKSHYSRDASGNFHNRWLTDTFPPITELNVF